MELEPQFPLHFRKFDPRIFIHHHLHVSLHNLLGNLHELEEVVEENTQESWVFVSTNIIHRLQSMEVNAEVKKAFGLLNESLLILVAPSLDCLAVVLVDEPFNHLFPEIGDHSLYCPPDQPSSYSRSVVSARTVLQLN